MVSPTKTMFLRPMILSLFALASCTVKTPCPLRINAGADDPECSTGDFILNKNDSTILDHVLKSSNCPFFENPRYFSAWNQAGEVTTLELRGCSSENLNSEVGELKKLNSLNISNIGLKSLPIEIGNLMELNSLDLDSNLLEDIPIEILRLRNITSLLYQNNALCHLDSVKVRIIENITSKPFTLNAQNCAK